MAFTFSKNERLCHKKLIAQLFIKGNRGLSRFPFRFTWAEAMHDGPFPVQVLFIVPKKNFPKATSRNRIKRQIRELYRLHKHELYDILIPLHRKYIFSISFQGKSDMDFDSMQTMFIQLFNQLKHEMEKSGPVTVHPADQDI